MKMDFLFSGVFWGLLLILIGASIILKVVFNINLPVIRTIFGILLIVFGIQILFGISFTRKHSSSGEKDVLFEERVLPFDPGHKEYNTIFGKSTLDLSEWNKDTGREKIEINTIFANTRIKISDKTPLVIKSNTVFGSIFLPGQNINAFGTYTYKSPSYKEGKPYLFLEINTVFGATEVIE
jgi:predicted membrane protein